MNVWPGRGERVAGMVPHRVLDGVGVCGVCGVCRGCGLGCAGGSGVLVFAVAGRAVQKSDFRREKSLAWLVLVSIITLGWALGIYRSV